MIALEALLLYVVMPLELCLALSKVHDNLSLAPNHPCNPCSTRAQEAGSPHQQSSSPEQASYVPSLTAVAWDASGAPGFCCRANITRFP